MIFEITQALLDEVKQYFENTDIKISAHDNSSNSDYVMLIESQNIGFEVFENEIIVYYFNDHIHFEDYSSTTDEDEPNYVERAKIFLNKLFTLTIKVCEIYKGNKKSSERYCFITPDVKEEVMGNIWYGLCRLINPFAKKKSVITIWRFDNHNKCFIEIKSS